MTALPVRYAPSGAIITNADGGPLQFGPGARLRLTETNSTMGGSLAVPGTAGVVCGDGFGGTAALVLTLTAPREKLEYRAKLKLDMVNTNTSVRSEVVLFLDTSVDDGLTYTNRAKVAHSLEIPNSVGGASGAEPTEINLPLILGSSLGVDDTEPTAALKLRARAQLTVGSAGSANVNAGSSSGAVTGLDGSIHMELEECF